MRKGCDEGVMADAGAGASPVAVAAKCTVGRPKVAGKSSLSRSASVGGRSTAPFVSEHAPASTVGSAGT